MSEKTGVADLLEFPCHYQFKAVGPAGESFRRSIIAAVARQAPVSEDLVRCRPSGKGNYQAVTVPVNLHSYQQLTCIYADLRQVPGLKMLL
jgi:putative lipoic acid-binding regulatory protein